MDILALSQEQTVLALIKQTLGFAPSEQYVDFTFKNNTSVPSDSVCDATLKGRDKTPLGEPGRWSGQKTIPVRRATLQKAGTQVNLRVPLQDGQMMADVLVELFKYHNFWVRSEELLFGLGTNGAYITLPTNYVPVVGTLKCKFAPNNLRFDPNGSEFTIELYKDPRLDVDVALARNSVSSVSVAVEGT